MPRKIYIPDEVLDSIKEHIAGAIPDAIAGFMSANEDEDTMTGQFGASLRTPKVRTVTVSKGEINGLWKWSIDYTKFRGEKVLLKTLWEPMVLLSSHSIGLEERNPKLFYFRQKWIGVQINLCFSKRFFFQPGERHRFLLITRKKISRHFL